MSTKKTRQEKRDERFKDIIRGADGKPIYTGDLYQINPGHTRSTFVIDLLIVSLCVVGSGFIDSRNAIGSFIIIIPYIVEACALFALVWNSVKVLAPVEVRAYSLDKASKAIAGASTILAIFAILGGVTSTLYLIKYTNGGEMVKSLLYVALRFCAAYSAKAYGKRYKHAEWTKI